MIEIDVRGLPELQSLLRNLAEEQVPFAISSALNSTAFALMPISKQRLQTAFDRPTPLVQKATRVEKATKQNLTAKVLIDPKRAAVLRVHEQGGPRGDQRLERFLREKGWLPSGWRAVPTDDMPLNAYGNPRQVDVKRIINGLPDVGGVPGFPKYFVVPALARRRKSLPAGVYLALTSFYATKLYHFAKTAQYQDRLDWVSTTEAEARRLLPGLMAAAIERAIRTAR